MTSPDEIWLVAEVLSNTLATGQMLETKHRSQFLKILKNFPSNMRFTSQWIPSHIGLFGNDTADLFVTENLMSRRTKIFDSRKDSSDSPLATPDHLLFCAGLEREDIFSSPLLVYDFLRTLGLMDLV
ncbi:hypothetical protein TNCV_1862491 [Trichonephila clavipes]|nr:hypothetical protein TNCV_1862491 [Trichonephila clavipes]